MSVTYGFYDSLNGDRKYNAKQLSKLFDGIIRDGVFISIGDGLTVSAASNMNVNVGLGKAWFNHTWTNNDALFLITVPQSEVVLNRIDTVVLEVDSRDEVRANVFKIVKGTPSSEPISPELINTELVHQYPLCDIYVGAEVTEIFQADITNRVGTSDCPFVTGVLETLNVDNLLAQWESAFDLSLIEQSGEFDTLVTQKDQAFDSFLSTRTSDFDEWFQIISDILDENTAANLLNLITEMSYYSTHKLNLDANDIYTEVQHKRADGTLILKSVLSGGTSPKYTTRTETKYATDGVTVVWTKAYTINYDANDNVVSEVLT